jgi:hypothetical protein
MNLNSQIQCCYTTTGKLSMKKISPLLMESLKKETSFLDEFDPTVSERVYCILNNITSVVRCPITDRKLKYCPNKKEYRQTSEYAAQFRITKNPADFKELERLEYAAVVDAFANQEFCLLEKTDLLGAVGKILKCTHSKLSKRGLFKKKDLVCSLFHYTPHIPPTDLAISERYYCIKHDIKDYPTHDGMLLPFVNRFVGYAKYPNKKIRYADVMASIKDEIEKSFIVRQFIKDKDTNTTSRVEVECKTCGSIFQPLFKNKLWDKIYCSTCNGTVNKSLAENELADYVESLVGANEVIRNDRSFLGGKELDIYIPSMSIAIEYCGILWHSYGTRYPNNAHKEISTKHLEKYQMCAQKGVRLLTVFENEWILKKEIVKSIIANKLGRTSTTIYARKCVAKGVSCADAREFLDNNHIQGACVFSDAYGLYQNDQLVALMCFGKRRLSRGESKFELIRYCNLLNHRVVGGASKVLKASGVKDCISYCDLKYSDGSMYHAMGMKLLTQTPPNYYYTKDNMILEHRMKYQKHTLITCAEDSRKTEKELMYDRGYRRIYDCGHLVFKYTQI